MLLVAAVALHWTVSQKKHKLCSFNNLVEAHCYSIRKGSGARIEQSRSS